jgi:hypothetical protein
MATTPTPTQRAVAILRGIGAPVTPGGIAILVAWQACEQSIAQTQGHNPLNTTLVLPGSRPLPGNPAGVQLYPSEAEGIRATVATLLNGRYPALVAALRAGNPAAFIAAAPEIRTWGTNVACVAARLHQPIPPTPLGVGPSTLIVAGVIAIPWMLAVLRRAEGR